jgi:Zn-dependent protease
MEVFLLVTAGWVFSVCLHEFGHAIVAFKGGDYSVRDKGYLTLNPLHYAHPFYSLVLPILFLLMGGIGLPGGAVYINHHLLRSKAWRTFCSLAGPFMNLCLILILVIPFWFGVFGREGTTSISYAVAFLVQLQISAVLFNLLPVPPLDGFQAISPWLPQDLTQRLMSQANVLTFILFLLLWYVPAVNQAFWWTVQTTAAALGIEQELALEGWRHFRFWKNL